MGSETNICLSSVQIKELIREGRIISEMDEDRIQPSSFEPRIGSEAFLLDTHRNGLLRASSKQGVYRTILELPRRERQRVDLTEGYELKRGYTYAIPLEEKIKLCEGEHIKSSPKSSFGRLFLNTRLLADYNPGIDEIHSQHMTDEFRHLWLLVQPLAFNLMAHSGLTLNQLRFFRGTDARLSGAEIIKELERNPLLLRREKDGTLNPSKPIVTDGLYLHLDLSGLHTEGIVALLARETATPIDLRNKEFYDPEDFFEPVKGEGKLHMQRGKYFLLSSAEILSIPKHLNAQLPSHSDLGFTGPLHFAGFIDNGFTGDLVFEVRSDEVSNIVLEDGMPISKLDIYRTPSPDKEYGEDINSNYQGQIGPRPSKHFKEFNYTFAAKNFHLLDREVLVKDAKMLGRIRNSKEPFAFTTEEASTELLDAIVDGFWHSRYDCEGDDLVLQPIPYVVIFGPNEQAFKYVRAKEMKKYGERRLFNKTSIGVGGHIIHDDGPDYLRRCIEREVANEELVIKVKRKEPILVGTILADDKAVDRDHFGLVYGMYADGTVTPDERSIESGHMISISELQREFSEAEDQDVYETWTQLLIPHLDEIYRICSEK